MKATRKQLKAALEAAVLGLRALNGATGTRAIRDSHIAATGYRIAERLGLGDVGWHPLDVIEERLKKI